METTTARVDVQRLQILNDRLCQTLEALNQVRFSAHNFSRIPAYGMGYGLGYGAAIQPTVNPYLGVGISAPVSHLGAGHMGLNQFGATQWGQPQAINPWGQSLNTGLGYASSFGSTTVNPIEIERARAFQFAQQSAQPVVSW